MCARLKAVPVAAKVSVSKAAMPSSPSPDKSAAMGAASISPGLHLPHETGLVPDVVGLLPEPALIVQILSEVVLHRDVSSDSASAIMSISATLLHR